MLTSRKLTADSRLGAAFRAASVAATLFLGVVACDARASLEHVLESEPHVFDHEGLGPVPLVGRVVNDGRRLGDPADMLVVDTVLVLADYPHVGATHLLDARTGGYLGTVGRSGRGPGEFTGPPRLAADPRGMGFWTFDVGQSRLSHVSLAAGVPERPDSLIDLDLPVLMYDVEFTSPDRLVGLGWFAGGRLARIDLAGDDPRIAYRGTVPEVGDLDLPERAAQQAYQGSLAVVGAGSLTIVATRNAGRVTVHDVAADSVWRVDAPLPFEPDLIFARGRHRPGPANRFGYVDVTVGSSELVYALFSGRLEAAFRGRAREARFVHVFEPNGALRCTLALDTPVTDAAIDETGSRLFGLATLPAPKVVAFDLAPADGRCSWPD
jgi:hypothetical protein